LTQQEIGEKNLAFIVNFTDHDLPKKLPVHTRKAAKSFPGIVHYLGVVLL